MVHQLVCRNNSDWLQGPTRSRSISWLTEVSGSQDPGTGLRWLIHQIITRSTRVNMWAGPWSTTNTNIRKWKIGLTRVDSYVASKICVMAVLKYLNSDNRLNTVQVKRYLVWVGEIMHKYLFKMFGRDHVFPLLHLVVPRNMHSSLTGQSSAWCPVKWE